MRIDFVITELFVGGAEKCLTELAVGLAETGDDVRVFSIGSLPSGTRGMLVDRLRSSGIEVESGQADSARQSFRTYRHLRDWLRQAKPDLCQTFLYHANVIGCYAAKAAKVETRVAAIRVAESRRIRCRIERAALRNSHAVACVSRSVEQFAAERLRCAAEKLVVIPNGVDVDRFASSNPFRWSEIGWPEEAVVALFVGRLHHQKGIELLQAHLDELAPLGANARLLIVGEGPLQGELRSWVDRFGDQRVQLLPWQADVAPLMRACRLLVLPSHFEGMPNVVLEAMAAARPVVCSRVEGSEELLVCHREQQSFPAGDGQAMAKLVKSFQDDPAFSAEVGVENQTHVRNEFSVPAMVDGYRSLYRLLLARRLERE